MLNSLELTKVPLLGIAAAILLIYLPYGFVVKARMEVGMNFSAPRSLFDQLPAYGKRATWAHQNAFETFMPFAAAALIAYVTGPHPQLLAFGLSGDAWIAALSGVFVLARLAYSLFYIADIPAGRSLMFGFGSLSGMGILLIGLFSGGAA